MTIDDYVKWAATDRPVAGQSRTERLTYFALGLIGEAGELADNLRKMLREDALDESDAVYELGDIIYHWASLVAELRQTPSALRAQSRTNIEARSISRDGSRGA